MPAEVLGKPSSKASLRVAEEISVWLNPWFSTKASTRVAREVLGKPRPEVSARLATEVLGKATALWAESASVPVEVLGRLSPEASPSGSRQVSMISSGKIINRSERYFYAAIRA